MKIKFDKRDVDSIKSLYEDGESFDYIANLHETHPELIKEVLKEKLRDVSGENVSVRLLRIILITTPLCFAGVLIAEVYLNYSTIFIDDIRIFFSVSFILLSILLSMIATAGNKFGKKDKRSLLQKMDQNYKRMTTTLFYNLLLLPLLILIGGLAFFKVENFLLFSFLLGNVCAIVFLSFLNFFNLEKLRFLFQRPVIILFARRGYNLDFLEKKFNVKSEVIKSHLISEGWYNEYLETVFEKTNENLEEFERDSNFNKSPSRKKRLENLNDKFFIKKLITNHENRTVEFKSTFFTDSYSKKPDVEREHDSIKAIAGFLNSYGGYLLIGVNDDQEIIGINNDKFLKNKDRYVRDIEGVISKTLGDLASRFVDIKPFEFTKTEKFKFGNKEYIVEKGTMICTIGIESSDIPIFCKHREYNTKRKSKMPLPVDHTFFYVRKNNETVHYDLEVANTYITQHFS